MLDHRLTTGLTTELNGIRSRLLEQSYRFLVQLVFEHSQSQWFLVGAVNCSCPAPLSSHDKLIVESIGVSSAVAMALSGKPIL